MSFLGQTRKYLIGRTYQELADVAGLSVDQSNPLSDGASVRKALGSWEQAARKIKLGQFVVAGLALAGTIALGLALSPSGLPVAFLATAKLAGLARLGVEVAMTLCAIRTAGSIYEITAINRQLPSPSPR